MKKLFVVALLLSLGWTGAWAEDAEEKPTRVAVFEIVAVDNELKTTADKIEPLLQAALDANPDFEMVERQRLKTIMEEQGLSLSGIVDEGEAVKVAKLAGANVLVTGRVFELDDELVLSTKIMGVETSRVFAKVAKGKLTDALGPIVNKMAAEIGKVIVAKREAFYAKKSAKDDPVAAILKAIEGKKRPTVAVKVSERHVTESLPDPAVESELMGLLDEVDIKIYDSKSKILSDWANAYMKTGELTPRAMENVDVIIVGEAFSELGARVHGMVSCKARIEIKAVDNKTGQVLAVGRTNHRAVDISEMIAAKTALVDGTRKLAPDFIGRMVSAWNKAAAESPKEEVKKEVMEDKKEEATPKK